jgi:hypothetical protein
MRWRWNEVIAYQSWFVTVLRPKELFNGVLGQALTGVLLILYIEAPKTRMAETPPSLHRRLGAASSSHVRFRHPSHLYSKIWPNPGQVDKADNLCAPQRLLCCWKQDCHMWGLSPAPRHHFCWRHGINKLHINKQPCHCSSTNNGISRLFRNEQYCPPFFPSRALFPRINGLSGDHHGTMIHSDDSNSHGCRCRNSIKHRSMSFRCY